MKVTLGSLTIPGDAAGWYRQGRQGLLLRELVGWKTLTDDKAGVDERPQGHGAFAVAHSWRSAVTITAKVWISAPDRPAARLLEDALGAVGYDAPVSMIVEDGEEVTQRVVSIAHVDVPDSRGDLAVLASIDLVARDPRRYGVPGSVGSESWSASTGLPSPSSGLSFPLNFPINFGTFGSDGRVTVTNPGTLDTPVIFTVSGPIDAGWSVTQLETGYTLSMDRQLVAGDVITLNSATMLATINGQSDVGRFLVSDDWMRVPGALSSTFQFAGTSTGAPVLTASILPAW